MKSKLFALAVALAMPVSAHAATLTTPEFHIFTQVIDLTNPAFITGSGFFGGAGERTATITQWHAGNIFVARTIFSVRASTPGNLDPIRGWQVVYTPPPGSITSVTFTVLDDTDFFTTQFTAN